MPFAITLRLSDEAAAAMAALWDALAAAGIDTDRRDLGYSAHITLAVYADDASAQGLAAGMRTAAASWRVMPVSLAALGLFATPSAILFAAPVPTPALLRCQSDLLAALPALTPQPHYRLGAWMPHVTLSGDLEDAAAAMRVMLPLWRPVGGRLEAVELLRFRPVELLLRLELPI